MKGVRGRIHMPLVMASFVCRVRGEGEGDAAFVASRITMIPLPTAS